MALRPEIRSANGSGYISREFGGVLDQHGLSHRRIKPHCPDEKGLMERAQRTLGEALEDEELEDYHQARRVIDRIIRWCNEERLHSALSFLRLVDYYRGPRRSCTRNGVASWPRPATGAKRRTCG